MSPSARKVWMLITDSLPRNALKCVAFRKEGVDADLGHEKLDTTMI